MALFFAIKIIRKKTFKNCLFSRTPETRGNFAQKWFKKILRSVGNTTQHLLPASCLEALVTEIWTGRRPVRWSRSRGTRPKRGGPGSAVAALRRTRRRRRGNGNGRWGSGSVSRWSESRCCSRCSGCCGTDEKTEEESQIDLLYQRTFLLKPFLCFLIFDIY